MVKRTTYFLLKLYVIIALFYTGVLFAQENALQQENEWYLNKPITAFEFIGLESISKLDMNNVLSKFRKKPFTLELLNEIQSVLYELEYFEEITPEAQRGINDQLVLVFSMVEKPTVSKIKFQGNKTVGNSVLQGVLTIRRGDIFNEFKIDTEIKAIKKKYFDQGYPEVNITYNVSPDTASKKKEVILEFIIDEQTRITVAKIIFTGNEILSKNKLKRIIASKKKSITRKGTFSEILLDQDKSIIVQEYYKRGYIDAQVVDIVVERKEDPKIANGTIITLTYIIHEGQVFTFEGVSFEGNSIYDVESLRSLFPLKKGDFMDLTKFQRGYDRVRLKYADQGFIFNQFDYEEVRDVDTHSVSYLVTIEELGQSHIENIILSGNVKTKDYVIERVIGIQEGDIFSASALNYARLNLMGTRYLRNVVPDSRPGSAPGLIDLIFNLEEDPTQDVRFGATIGGSAEFPLSLFVNWNQPNLLGRGLILNASGTASPFEQTISTSFTNPYLFNSPFGFFTSLSFSHEQVNNVPQDLFAPHFNAGDTSINYDPYNGGYVFTSTKNYNDMTYNAGDPFPGSPNEDEIEEYNLLRDYKYYGTSLNSVYNNSLMSYENYRFSFAVGSGYVYYSPLGKLGVQLRVGPTFNYVYYDKYIFRPADLQVRNNLERFKVYNILTLKGYYDGRDIAHIPSKGAYVSQEFNMYGGLLFGDAHYIKSTSLIEGHVTFFRLPVFENWAWKLVGAAQSIFTTIFPQFYYPEGTSYEVNGPSYTQRLDLNGVYNSRGWIREKNGEATWNTWFELRMPLYETVIWWDQFFEIARLWTNRFDVVPEFSDITQYRFTMGTGFRFVLQQFPIRIYLGKRFALDENWKPIWQTGNLAGADSTDGDGLDLIFTIGLDFF